MASTETTQKELQEQLDSLRKDLSEIRHLVKSLASEYAEEGKEHLRASANRAQAQAKETLADVEGEIQSHPLSSVAIAFGVGVLIGKLLNR
jgi:ElaB/YqjD/DUF883 family membrane-anchored ribosome-binding protein